MFYVEEENFLEELKNGKYVQLNEEGIDKVVKIIEEKDKEIENLNELIKELQEDIDVLTSDDDNDSVWNEKENM
jgi:peptidoglycan hydrolase CwlO-like protein